MIDAKPFDTRPYLILCEGDSDKRFLDNLIRVRNLHNEFQIRFPSRGTDKRAGRSKFGSWLDTASQSVDFERHIKSVIVVSDNDDDPEKSFAEVVQSLEKCDLPRPGQERLVAKRDGSPSLCIFMLPFQSRGNLETMCVSAILRKYDIRNEVEQFVVSTGISSYSDGKKDKARLQCIISAICEDRPEAGFAGHWWEKEDFHVPLNDAEFDDISNFLSSYGNIA